MKPSPFANLLAKVNVKPYRESIKDLKETLKPNARMKVFNANLPQNLGVLIEDYQLLSINGWLSPEGTLYACRWRQHKNISLALEMNCEAQMEREGYVKLTSMKWLLEDRYHVNEITQQQKETIENWHKLNEFPDQFFLEIKLLWNK